MRCFHQARGARDHGGTGQRLDNFLFYEGKRSAGVLCARNYYSGGCGLVGEAFWSVTHLLAFSGSWVGILCSGLGRLNDAQVPHVATWFVSWIFSRVGNPLLKAFAARVRVQVYPAARAIGWGPYQGSLQP